MASVMLYPCMFCVALSMDLFVLYVVCLKQFAICLGVLLFFVECDGVVVSGALLDRTCMVFQRMLVLCMWSQ